MPKKSADLDPGARLENRALPIRPRGLIFDLDGTLADTIADLAQGVNRILARYGFPVHGHEKYKLMVGDGFSNLMRRALPPQAVTDTELFARVLEDARDSYNACYLDQTKPYPGMPETLSRLDFMGIRLAVLSNKPHEMASAMVAALFPGIRFDDVRGQSPGQALKPDPATALAICRKASLEPGLWALVGDSGVDMLTAKAAGMAGLGAAWGFRGAEELRAAGADAVLYTPPDILSFFQQAS
ncbi:MAG TPA: HAD family hydrolase [Rectinemataceae bacterium]